MGRRLFPVIFLICLLSGCGPAGDPVTTSAPVATTVATTTAPTDTPPTATATATPTPSPAPTATKRSTATPHPTALPTPAPTAITAEQALAGYQAWLDSWGTESYEQLTEDEMIRGIFYPCAEPPVQSRPQVVSISQAEQTAVVYDELVYWICHPNFGRSRSPEDAANFTLTWRGSYWAITEYTQVQAPTPVRPTRDPNAPTPVPVTAGPTAPPARQWSPSEAASSAFNWVNYYRSQNGVGQLAYNGGNWQTAANTIAQRYYETNRGLTQAEVDQILAANGISGAGWGYSINNVPLVWGSCHMDPNLDPADVFSGWWGTARETTDGGIRSVAVGYYAYNGDCGPSATFVFLRGW